jgi:hypothetical protein
MKFAMLSLSASALWIGLSLGPPTSAHHPGQAPMIEGRNRPILLQRMVVTATPLPD